MTGYEKASLRGWWKETGLALSFAGLRSVDWPFRRLRLVGDGREGRRLSEGANHSQLVLRWHGVPPSKVRTRQGVKKPPHLKDEGAI